VKRRVAAVLATVFAGLMLFAAPAPAHDDHGTVESNDWNIPLTNIRLP
jgi:hypothetical protein